MADSHSSWEHSDSPWALLTDCRQTACELANKAFEQLKCTFGKLRSQACELYIWQKKEKKVDRVVHELRCRLRCHECICAAQIWSWRARDRSADSSWALHLNVQWALLVSVNTLTVATTFVLFQTTSWQARRRSADLAREEWTCFVFAVAKSMSLSRFSKKWTQYI